MKLKEYLDKLKNLPKNVALYLEFPNGDTVPFSKTDIEIKNYEEVLNRGTVDYDYNCCFYRPIRYEVENIIYNKDLKVNVIKLIE